MKYIELDLKRIRNATLLSIIPGLGQFYNKQVFKGIVFLSVFLLFIVEMLGFGAEALAGLISLGSTPGEHHSLFMLIEGSLQILIIAIFLLFYIVNIFDARKVAKLWVENKKVNTTMKSIMVNVSDSGFPYLLTIPAYLAMIFAIIFPVLVTLLIAFTNYDFYHIPPASLIDWVGFKNFFSIFFLSSYRDTFMSVLSWTIIWTICATTLQIVIGIFTAVVLNQKFIIAKRVFGIIFLLPWAVPAFITIMSFSNMFNDSIGAINTQVIPLIDSLLPFIDLGAIPWKTDPFWTKIAIIMVQGWLGFPYIYVLVSGILQSIPEEQYEAAKIDGANAIKRFRHITMPAIFMIAAPIFITQYTGNFNNFTMIYLFNEGGPGSIGAGAGSTDILISWIYKLTTGTSPQYSVAAAVTLFISAFVIIISLLVFKRTRAFEMED
ncbi:carbohydrate ABC transporter permease [Oceanobacillus chungangensis]|uniref:Maltose/maltodextrin transport system permease protein n=1 Tax=Oceanobacillus chungangensis TaxID=1229152 RepID=A0A3D8PHR2_9BACI|nr:sugar ABC transporter permease [Oceanobacillus chungangensis]RDW15610.1 sugar ABC transporter permease [Oceanobacillus chungangensis]